MEENHGVTKTSSSEPRLPQRVNEVESVKQLTTLGRVYRLLKPRSTRMSSQQQKKAIKKADRYNTKTPSSGLATDGQDQTFWGYMVK